MKYPSFSDPDYFEVHENDYPRLVDICSEEELTEIFGDILGGDS